MLHCKLTQRFRFPLGFVDCQRPQIVDQKLFVAARLIQQRRERTFYLRSETSEDALVLDLPLFPRNLCAGRIKENFGDSRAVGRIRRHANTGAAGAGIGRGRGPAPRPDWPPAVASSARRASLRSWLGGSTPSRSNWSAIRRLCSIDFETSDSGGSISAAPSSSGARSRRR